ncbi:MAG: hypothetical protein JSR34_02320 [Proteobacteria bacterium]|nr:hypothetical protein [Pseudomonadota bacterium]
MNAQQRMVLWLGAAFVGILLLIREMSLLRMLLAVTDGARLVMVEDMHNELGGAFRVRDRRFREPTEMAGHDRPKWPVTPYRNGRSRPAEIRSNYPAACARSILTGC